jgi:hypothetical protein
MDCIYKKSTRSNVHCTVPVGVHPPVPDVDIQGADWLPEVDEGSLAVLGVQHGQR